jgi:RpiR family glv operon transcriptional regulator
MLKNARKQKILDLVNQKGYVTLELLAQALDTSESTVRRDLTEAEQEMTRYILNNRELVSQIGIVKLGTLLLSSKSSVLRLAKKLGFNGFSDMKHTLQHSPITPMLEPMDLMGDLKQGLSHMLNYSEQTNFQPFLSKLKNARMIYLFATGFSQNNYTKEFSKDLMVNGRSNMLISGETNLALSIKSMSPDDLIVFTSLSGETPIIKDSVRNLSFKEIPIASFTRFGKNFLSNHATFPMFFEANDIPSPNDEVQSSMVGLTLILDIVTRKYREFILYDE